MGLSIYTLHTVDFCACTQKIHFAFIVAVKIGSVRMIERFVAPIKTLLHKWGHACATAFLLLSLFDLLYGHKDVLL